MVKKSTVDYVGMNGSSLEFNFFKYPPFYILEDFFEYELENNFK